MSSVPALLPPGQISAACHYCGLPVTGAAPRTEEVYCCFGCRFASAVVGAGGEQGAANWMATALGISVFCTMNVVMLTMALWSYTGNLQTVFEERLADFLRFGALLFTAPVLLLLGRPLAIEAWSQGRRGVLSTDLLLLAGVAAACAVSVVSTVRGIGHIYYEVSCVILCFVTLGRWLEATGRLQASTALDELEQLMPDDVHCVTAPGTIERVPRQEITVGQQVRVRSGERVPFDGAVLRGRSVVDEHFFTGESAPVEKFRGNTVLGGSLNLEGDLFIEVTAPASEGALGRLIDAVRSARLRKGPYQLLTDQWSQRFFPIILTIACITFIVHSVRSDWESGLLTALSVVLIACPCALALATPLAVWAALAAAAQRGVLFRSGEALERLAGVRALRWDKTGTLTTGTPTVSRFDCEDESERSLVENFAAMLTAASSHIYSAAIWRFLGKKEHQASIGDVMSFAGRGLQINTPGHGCVSLGSLPFMADNKLTLGPVLAEAVTKAERADLANVFIGWNGKIRGAILLDEALRPEAVEAIEACSKLNLNLAVLTGDRHARAVRWQHRLHLDVQAELLPETKLEAIRRAHVQFGSVVMVGDGLNDAPALAAADVGIALGCGADVTRDAADVCLLPNDLRLVPWAVRHAQRTVSIIRQNLGWSFAYNGGGVLLAACGWLHPAVAAVLMVVSSLMVLGNSLRLRADTSSETTERSPTAKNSWSLLSEAAA